MLSYDRKKKIELNKELQKLKIKRNVLLSNEWLLDKQSIQTQNNTSNILIEISALTYLIDDIRRQLKLFRRDKYELIYQYGRELKKINYCELVLLNIFAHSKEKVLKCYNEYKWAKIKSNIIKEYLRTGVYK